MRRWPAGVRLIRHDVIDSTNEEARRLAHAGEVGPVWIMAFNQTAGRGRRGRSWECAVGNLAATLLIRPTRDDAGQLSFAAALAVSDVVCQYVPAARIAVKWPNDVLADGRKLAGILLESGDGWLAIGIGINLASHPDGTEFPAVSLAALDVTPPSPELALEHLAVAFADWYDCWLRHGFEPLRTAWLARAKGVGMFIRARLPHAEYGGIFESIDASGALILNQGGARHMIAAGEVFF